MEASKEHSGVWPHDAVLIIHIDDEYVSDTRCFLHLSELKRWVCVPVVRAGGVFSLVYGLMIFVRGSHPCSPNGKRRQYAEACSS